MNTVLIAEDPLEPSSWEQHEVDDVREFLFQRYERFPDNARIYHQQVAQDHDVTPSDEETIERLGRLQGTFYVVLYPGDPATIIIAIIAVVVTIAATFLLRPSIPNVGSRQQQNNSSSNNELSNRQNKARPKERIPDIYGTTRSVPDLISVAYKIYEENQEVEYAYMCIGRGSYDIPVEEIRDDNTPMRTISGQKLEVYEPYTSPNKGDPSIRLGAPIDTPVHQTIRANDVNGQQLEPPNSRTFNDPVVFVYPNAIKRQQGVDVALSDKFSAGDIVFIDEKEVSLTVPQEGNTVQADSVMYTSGYIELSVDRSVFQQGDDVRVGNVFFNDANGARRNLAGTYTINSVSGDSVRLDNPAQVNGDWDSIPEGGVTVPGVEYSSFAGGTYTANFDFSGTYQVSSTNVETLFLLNPEEENENWQTLESASDQQSNGYVTTYIRSSIKRWQGYYTLDDPDMEFLYLNMVGDKGWWRRNSENRHANKVDIEVEVVPLDEQLQEAGEPELFYSEHRGFEDGRAMGVTLKIEPSFGGRCKVRARKADETNVYYEGTYVDEVKWKDLFSVSQADEEHFGNVTTVQSATLATAGALAIKDRKLNMMVTRRLPEWLGGNEFSDSLKATRNVADILSAICLDKYLGNRSVEEVDFENFYQTAGEIEEYFGTPVCAEFGHTFDDDEMSFEETVASIASAVFCNAYRLGSTIKLSFERETDESVLLFNHRNKLPESETRTIRFGNQGDNDGVEYEYVDPTDDAVVTFYIPEDQSAVNPKKVESIGVRGKLHAHFHAWRVYNKLRYQNTTTQFEATQEADLLVLADRVLVTDDTRAKSTGGQIEEQHGLEIRLSQPHNMVEGVEYTIFLQHTDATVESMGVSATDEAYWVVLQRAPRTALSLDAENYAQATYDLVANSNSGSNAFLVDEKEPQGDMTSKLKAINYDQRYYRNDKDFINGSITGA